MVAVAAWVLALAACGSDAGDADGDAGGEDPPPAAETRTVEHPGGVTEVPADAERVVALDENAALVLLDLGVEPTAVLGTFLTEGTAPVLDTYDIEVTASDINNPSLEAVAALRPDLLVGTDHPATVEAYERWSTIAPTVLVPYSGDWREQVSIVAETVGREAQGDERIAELDSEIDRVAGRLEDELDQPPTVSILGLITGRLFAVSEQNTPSGRLLESLGVVRPDAQRDGDDDEIPGFYLLSAEVLDQHDADLVTLLSGGIYEAGSVRDLPTFSALDGDVVEVDGEQWTAAHPFGVAWTLADLEAVLLDGGEPATGDDVVERWDDFTNGDG